MPIVSEHPNDPVAVFKLGQEKYMRALVQEGHVYLNSAEYFAKLEEKGGPRADADEGASYCKQATGAMLSMEHDGVFKPLGTIQGPIIHLSDEQRHANVYCLHMRRRHSFDTPFDLLSLEFGDTVVIFKDYVEFLRRLTKEAERQGHSVAYGTVEYVDRSSYSGPMGPFRKFSTYSQQDEHRIVLTPGTGRPLSLFLGSLQDIALVSPANGRFKLFRKALATTHPQNSPSV